uniref:Uncharacterized protein n=1 Tax=Anopheles epiroticus TaxID=199890 RepID=A0A182NZW7_9DIPT
MHRLGQLLHREVKRKGNMPSDYPIGADVCAFYRVPTNAIRLPNFFPAADFIMQLLVIIGKDVIYDKALLMAFDLLRKTFVQCCLLYLVIVSVSGMRLYKTYPIIRKVITLTDLKYLNSTAVPYNTPKESKVDLFIDIKKPLVKPRMNFVLSFDVASDTLQAPLYNQTFDFCEFLRNPGMHRLGQLLHREVKRSGSMPLGCPIPAIVYKFDGIQMHEVRFPNFLPAADFLMKILVIIGKDVIYDSRWYGTIKRVRCIQGVRC